MARHAKAQIIGRLGRTPELNHTKNGGAVLNLTVAVDRGPDSNPDWYRVTVWRDAAEQVDRLGLAVGDLVFAEGRLALAHWTAPDGTERTRPEITAGAPSVQLLTRARPREPKPNNAATHAQRRTQTDPRRQYQYDAAPPPPEYDDGADEPPF